MTGFKLSVGLEHSKTHPTVSQPLTHSLTPLNPKSKKQLIKSPTHYGNYGILYPNIQQSIQQLSYPPSHRSPNNPLPLPLLHTPHLPRRRLMHHRTSLTRTRTRTNHLMRRHNRYSPRYNGAVACERTRRTHRTPRRQRAIPVCWTKMRGFRPGWEMRGSLSGLQALRNPYWGPPWDSPRRRLTWQLSRHLSLLRILIRILILHRHRVPIRIHRLGRVPPPRRRAWRGRIHTPAL